MNIKSVSILICAICAVLTVSPSAHGQFTLGQVDDFSAVTNGGWSEGGNSPNQPVHDIGLGPDGLAGHLRNVSTGFQAGGRWQMFNFQARWLGDYSGINAITIDFDNRSGNGTDGNFRIAFFGSGGTFISDDFLVADGAGWQQGVFDLATLSHLSASGGTGLLTDTLSNVTQIEILSSVSDTPSISNAGLVQGDPLFADFRMDNMRAAGQMGDVDLNGAIDFSDIPAFIAALQAGTMQFEADIDGDGDVDFADIPFFISVLSQQ